MFEKLKNKEKMIAVIGLGYVGLPLALELSKEFEVVGFDINEVKIASLKRGLVQNEDFKQYESVLQNVYFTSKSEELLNVGFFIVAVPTDVDEHRVPDLKPLQTASKVVAAHLKKNAIVVYESTTYPGCTEEDCLPILEQVSGLNMGVDFGLGYSPERINPGDTEKSVRSILKIISANSEAVLDEVEKVYATVVDAGLYRAPSIKVAEAAKVIENTQRDLNISLMNELSMLFDRLNIDTYEVLKAAGTKWNFLPFKPGLVGGHCISVDPHYLMHKAKQVGYEPEVILSGRRVNDYMPLFIGRKIAQALTNQGKNLSKCSALVMGVTFKEDVADIRNSRVFDLINELQEFSIKTNVFDPYADINEAEKHHKVLISNEIGKGYDVVVLAVSHAVFKKKGASFFKKIMQPNGILFDLKAMFEAKDFEGFEYLRL